MKLTLVFIYQHHLCHHCHYYHLPHNRPVPLFPVERKCALAKKSIRFGVRKTYIQNPTIHLLHDFGQMTSPFSLSTLVHKRGFLSFIYNRVSNGMIGEKILCNLHITTQVLSADGLLLCPWGYHSHRREVQSQLWHPASTPSHIHPRLSIHLQFLILLVLVRDVPWIGEHFFCIVFTLDSQFMCNPQQDEGCSPMGAVPASFPNTICCLLAW